MLRLAVLSILFLALKVEANRFGGILLDRWAPSIDWLATACVPSLLVTLCLVIALKVDWKASPRPETRWREVLKWSLLWLAIWYGASILAAVNAGHWITYARGAPLVAAFLVIAPLQEELAFRGILFQEAERTFGKDSIAPVAWTSVAFSLSHFWLHLDAPFSGPSLMQVAFTLPMGFVFGMLKKETQSVWPGLALHVLTNLPGCF